MGTGCSRRKICTEPGAIVDDTPLDWQLVTFPGEAEHQPSPTTSGSENRRLRSLSTARGRWIRARLKIKLLRRFRILWSRAGSWLNLHPVGTVDQNTRDKAARAWAGSNPHPFQYERAVLPCIATSTPALRKTAIGYWRETFGHRSLIGGGASTCPANTHLAACERLHF
jgi:hypothetical protein